MCRNVLFSILPALKSCFNYFILKHISEENAGNKLLTVL